MPRMDDEASAPRDGLAKLLLIGDGKVGKTHYAGMAAAAGFNVLYFDGDVGRPTLRSLPKEARSRIYALDVADTLEGGVIDHKFIDVIQEWNGGVTFKWNDSQQRMSSRRTDQPGDVIWDIKPAALDHTCVWVLDSWTGLTESMTQAAAIANSVNLSQATTEEMRAVYQGAGQKATQVLKCIRSLRCHVIVLAHPDEFTHTTKPKNQAVGKIKEGELVVDWTKMIPKSTSKPASLLMAKYFTDIAWAETNATGSERRLNFRLSDSRVSGGHFDDVKNVDEYSFAKLVKQIGGSLPSSAGATMSHWWNERVLTEADVSSVISSAAPQQKTSGSTTKILDGTQQSTVKGPGMTHLFAAAKKG